MYLPQQKSQSQRVVLWRLNLTVYVNLNSVTEIKLFVDSIGRVHYIFHVVLSIN